jgi:hypothetical protein
VNPELVNVRISVCPFSPLNNMKNFPLEEALGMFPPLTETVYLTAYSFSVSGFAHHPQFGPPTFSLSQTFFSA